MSFVQNFPFFSIILSLVCAVVSFAANARWARRLSIFLLSASVVLQGSLLVYCTVHHVRYYYMMGHYPAPWGNELTAGILESFLAMLFAGVMLLCVLGGMGRILRDVPADRQKLYWVMVDLAHVALMALCYTNDIFTGYVFIEVLTIASCALLSVRRGGRALTASARYMIFAMSLGLMTAGLSIKSGLFPFHLWMPDTYGQATPASSGILSGVVSKGYIVFLIKVIYQVIGIDVFAATGIQTVLLLFGIGGMIAGSVSAIFARRLTTMIAFSSAAQIGYIYMGLGMGTQAALAAVLFQIVSHALTKPMLFLSGADLVAASGGHQDFNSLRAAAHRDPTAGCVFTVGALSMVGIPIFAGFIPKLYFLYTTLLLWVPEAETEHTRRLRWASVPGLVFVALNIAVGLRSYGLMDLFRQGMDLFCQ